MLTLSGLDKVRILGILGAKKIEELVATDIVRLAQVANMKISDDEGAGLLSFVQTPENLGEVAVQFLMTKAESGDLQKLLEPGTSASPELDLGEHDFLSRCPECQQPELLDTRYLGPDSSTQCPHCYLTYSVDLQAE